MGQYEGRLCQHNISKKLSIFSIPLATVDRVIVRCTREGKKCTASRSGRLGPLDRTLRLVKINV